MFRSTGCGLVVISLILVGVEVPARAGNWPQWRGPERDGAVSGFTAPETWPKSLKQNWRITVGEGHSSPVVADNRVYIQARQGEDEFIRCLALTDGKEIWAQRYPAPYKVNSAARAHGKGPKSTPAVHDGRLFAFSIHGLLSCFDAASGKLNWRKDFSETYPQTSPLYGVALSPLVTETLCIVHVGGNDGGALTAFDVTTGEVRWSALEDGPSYSSPIVFTGAGPKQVVTQTQRNVVGVGLEDGRGLWKIPFTTPYVQNAVTLLAYKDLLIFSGLMKPTTAIRLEKSDGTFAPREVWSNKQVPMYMSSPVLVEDLVFGMSNRKKGQVFCLNGDTGEILWQGPPRMGDNVAIIRAGDVLFLQTTDADLIVIQADDKGYKPLATYKVAHSPTWAHPAIVGNRILIKDKTTLACFSLPN